MEVTPTCSLLNKEYISPPIWGQQVYDSLSVDSSNVPEFLANITSNIWTIKISYLLHDFFKGMSNHYNAFEEDIAVLNVYFDTTTFSNYEYLC